jgi:hypothetical protein
MDRRAVLGAKRVRLWPNVKAKHFVVHDEGEEFADVTAMSRGPDGTVTPLVSVFDRTEPAQAPCMMACMFSVMTASTARSSALGLNCTSSLPASASGTWPGGR